MPHLYEEVGESEGVIDRGDERLGGGIEGAPVGGGGGIARGGGGGGGGGDMDGPGEEGDMDGEEGNDP